MPLAEDQVCFCEVNQLIPPETAEYPSNFGANAVESQKFARKYDCRRWQCLFLADAPSLASQVNS